MSSAPDQAVQGMGARWVGLGVKAALVRESMKKASPRVRSGEQSGVWVLPLLIARAGKIT